MISGRRHHNCFATVRMLLGKKLTAAEFPNKYERFEVQGFLTSDDRFVDREEAAKIAFEAGQTKTLRKRLFSEDIY